MQRAETCGDRCQIRSGVMVDNAKVVSADIAADNGCDPRDRPLHPPPLPPPPGPPPPQQTKKHPLTTSRLSRFHLRHRDQQP